MDYKQIALQKHEEWNGKLEVVSRAPLQTKEDLSTAYTPGVAAPLSGNSQRPGEGVCLYEKEQSCSRGFGRQRSAWLG